MKIAWQPKARKQLKKLGNKPIQARILAATAELAKFPEVANVKHLSNHLHGYRLRVGDYRILFNVLDDIAVVSIEEVMKRDENTY
jgi:mRNA-degrading endonuclease RelE of RelBE toxin-antitoxin system